MQTTVGYALPLRPPLLMTERVKLLKLHAPRSSAASVGLRWSLDANISLLTRHRQSIVALFGRTRLRWTEDMEREERGCAQCKTTVWNSASLLQRLGLWKQCGLHWLL